MVNEPRTGSTVKIMHDMAQRMRETADELDRLTDQLEKQGNWDVASDALGLVTNMIPSLRLDLLAARPIREHQYLIADLKAQSSVSGTSKTTGATHNG